MRPTQAGIRPPHLLYRLTDEAIRALTVPTTAAGIHRRSFVLHSNSTSLRRTPDRESVITLPIERRCDTSGRASHNTNETPIPLNEAAME